MGPGCSTLTSGRASSRWDAPRQKRREYSARSGNRPACWRSSCRRRHMTASTSRTARPRSEKTSTGQFSTPAGSRVRGAQSRTLTPSRCNRCTLERATRLWAMSPRISRLRPAKLSPQVWRRLKQSSRAWVGWACQPSPPLTMPQGSRSARKAAAPLLG